VNICARVWAATSTTDRIRLTASVVVFLPSDKF